MTRKIKLPYIYENNKWHTLEEIEDNVFKFIPAEDWMPFQVTYDTDCETIVGIDTDGLGRPIWVGDVIEGMSVESIYFDDNFGYMIKFE